MVKIRSSEWRYRLPIQVMLVAAVALIPRTLLCQANQQLPSQDFEGRAEINGVHPISKRTEFLLGTEFHYSRDQGHLVYRKIGTGFAFRWYKFLTIEPYYQYSVSDSVSGGFSHENRLALAATVGAPWKRWYISDRNTGERRFLQSGPTWRFHNRVQFRRPIQVERKRMSVFVWDEVYYTTALHRWYRNRVAVGTEQRLSRKISVDIFYMRQNDGYTKLGDFNGIEMDIRTIF